LLGEVGLDPDHVRAVLDGTEYADAVRADAEEAQALGANGVPFFVIDRKYGISGAQPADVFLHALRTAYAD
jgi:predicted DsbA family dithiol-disulfide isomerase